MENILGWTLFSLSLGMIFYAMPRQIQKNYRDGKSELTPSLVFFPFAIYVLRAVFVFIKGFDGAWYVYVPDTIGAIGGER